MKSKQRGIVLTPFVIVGAFFALTILEHQGAVMPPKNDGLRYKCADGSQNYHVPCSTEQQNAAK